MEIISSSLERVRHWVESRNYKGYDPGDGLTSFLRPLTFGNLFTERILLQLIWKSPYNVRPYLGVVPRNSTKGRGFMAWGYLLLHKAEQDQVMLNKALDCLEWLECHNDAKTIGLAWGNDFDFTTRGGRMTAHTPTVVWSGLIGQVFLEAYTQTGDEHYLDAVGRICEWVLTLPRNRTQNGTCLSYTPKSHNWVHNSNLLGAALLAGYCKFRPTKEYEELATEAVRYSCAHQHCDGAWWYGEEPKHHWIDNFHTAYNLDSIKRYTESTNNPEFTGHISRGYAYFKKTFFESSGCPRYYHSSTYPIDIQCAAQAIDTFCLFAGEDREALNQAQRIAQWTIMNMQSNDGHFYFRKYPLVTAKTPYFHWGQATMFKALAHLLLAGKFRNETRPGKDNQQNIRPREIPVRETIPRYALITPARNEEKFIEGTIRSVISQSSLPVSWIVVSDGSTDSTDNIVREYARQYSWIKLISMPERTSRNFAGKAAAFKEGLSHLEHLEFEIIGNLDADITFGPDYFDFLLKKFIDEPKLGVAGTPFVEDAQNPGHHTYAHQFSQLEHVSGACQLFRRECFEQIGGYKPIKGGAIDWIAVTTARMMGWKTRTFTEKVCIHHRKIGTGNNRPLMVGFHYGTKAYYVGSHPLWALLRGLFQMRRQPLVIGGVLFELGYLWAMLTRMPRAVTPDLMAFHRGEQIARLRKAILRT